MIADSALVFRFVCNNTPISNLLVYAVLLTKLKNNYTIGPLITNKNGEIRIARDVMLKIVESAKADYPMDYAGTLDDCSGLKIIVETINELKTRIKRSRKFYPDEANELKKLIKNCENRKYKGKRVVYQWPIKFELKEVNLTSSPSFRPKIN